MQTFIYRLIKLIFGLFLFSLGIATTLNANIGYAPWDVFHSGFAITTGISIGSATIFSGVAIGIITIILGEKFGLGTVLNMFLIGIFLDFILESNLLPIMDTFISGAIMMILGLFIISLGSYFYIGSGFGAGPRDSLMIFLTRKTKLPIGLCRGAVEFTAAIVGWQLGGLIGLGTILSAATIGICVQITFSILKFDTTSIEHETLKDTFKILIKKEKQSIQKTS